MRKLLVLLCIIVLLLSACTGNEKDKAVDKVVIEEIGLDTIFEFLDSEKETNFTPTAGFDKKNSQDTYGKIEEKTYFSKTTGANRKCNVYTPPNYNPVEKYPVMYLLHGIGGTHTEWMGGNPNEILSNLINQGKAKPIIVVMPNARAMNPDSVPSDMYDTASTAAFHNFYNDLRDDLMPFIKKNYSISDKRHHTAVAGLSMGGMTALHVGLKMPEKFGYIGSFSAAPTLPQYTGNNNQMTLPSDYKNNTFILICCGSQDGLITFSKGYNKALNDNGVQTYYYEIDGDHNFTFWKNGLYFFAQCIF